MSAGGALIDACNSTALLGGREVKLEPFLLLVVGCVPQLPSAPSSSGSKPDISVFNAVLPSQCGLAGCFPRLEGSCLCISQLLGDLVCHFILLCGGFLGSL